MYLRVRYLGLRCYLMGSAIPTDRRHIQGSVGAGTSVLDNVDSTLAKRQNSFTH